MFMEEKKMCISINHIYHTYFVGSKKNTSYELNYNKCKGQFFMGQKMTVPHDY